MSPTTLITILKPLKPSDIPSEAIIVSEGVHLIDSTSSWQKGKVYYGNVQTYHQAKDANHGAPWHCRVSEHEMSFDELWQKLSVDKPVHEKNYIHELRKVTKVKEISSTAQIWSLYYTFTPPISPRVFTVLQVIHLSEDKPRTGIIVTLSIDLSSPGDEALAALEEKGTRGHYVSVERLQELESGLIEWRMATSSTPGGSIPSWFVESAMPKKIASDVPQFLEWYRSL